MVKVSGDLSLDVTSSTLTISFPILMRCWNFINIKARKMESGTPVPIHNVMSWVSTVRTHCLCGRHSYTKMAYWRLVGVHQLLTCYRLNRKQCHWHGHIWNWLRTFGYDKILTPAFILSLVVKTGPKCVLMAVDLEMNVRKLKSWTRPARSCPCGEFVLTVYSCSGG